MKRRINVSLYAGFLLTLAAAIGYFTVLVQFPVTRDVPWLPLALFGVALGLLWRGLARAFGQPEQYRGRIAGPLLALFSVTLMGLFSAHTFWYSRQLPAATGAPHVGQTAPDFTLPDANGAPVTLSRLWAPGDGAAAPRRVLLIFYRGYW